jgi:hypothetical protein
VREKQEGRKIEKRERYAEKRKDTQKTRGERMGICKVKERCKKRKGKKENITRKSDCEERKRERSEIKRKREGVERVGEQKGRERK